ncbi:hypothetical protein [Deinococcus yunweiensis]|uniref:hypothetical protein n=1 Tax=Deinococcus yunweiensis TaxID=367282 RepID=UPI00398EB599
MIETIQRTGLQVWTAAGGTEWAEGRPILRHRTVAGDGASAVDVIYQLELHGDSTLLLQLDATYHVVFQDVAAVDAHAAQDATWPYFRIDAASQHGPVGGELLAALPVDNPLRPASKPVPIASAAASPLAADPLVPDTLRTELQMMAALRRIARKEVPWLWAAAQIYLVLNHLADRRRRRRGAEMEALTVVLKEHVGCTVEELLALPAPSVHHYRDVARTLMIVATHAVMELRADIDTGQIEDGFNAALNELFSSEASRDDAPAAASRSGAGGNGDDVVPPAVTDALKTLVMPVLTPVKAYRHHSGRANVMVGAHTHTAVAYGTGYDFRADPRSESVGHTAHLIAVYLVSEPEGQPPLTLSSVEDVSEEFETWAAQHEFMTLQVPDRLRLEHALTLDQSDDLRTRAFTDAGSWASSYTDIRALNAALLTLDLSEADFHNLATLSGIDLGCLVVRSDCPGSLLAQLAGHRDPEVRAEVAEHPSTPAAALYALDKDYLAVRRSLARNPSLPAALQLQYVHSHDETLRAHAALNPSLDASLLTHLAEDPSSVVRLSVAKHPSTPTDALISLLDDEIETVSDRALRELERRSTHPDQDGSH